MSWRSMPRRFIQYNDLVFDGTESINSAPSETISTKYGSTEFLFKHGSYVSTRDRQLLLKEDKITLDVAINTLDWDLDLVKAHVDFIRQQLITRGKLWAIDTGGTLIYTEVLLDSYSPTYEWTYRDDGYICFSLEFTNPSATWKKANGNTTWLLPYELCGFQNMLASCFENSDCQNCDNPAQTQRCYCEDCGLQCCELSNAYSLCELRGDIEQDFFEKCSSKWRVVHNCEYGRETFGDDKLWGQAFCDGCVDNIFSEQFYADTALDVTNATVTLQGEFIDPEITINDYTVKLEGTFNQGYLSISSDGTIYSFSEPWQLTCDESTKVSNSVLKLCDNQWWRIHRSFNQITVRGIISESFCVFINYERLTY